MQMVDENPYVAPVVDESKWFTGGHLGGANPEDQLAGTCPP